MKRISSDGSYWGDKPALQVVLLLATCIAGALVWAVESMAYRQFTSADCMIPAVAIFFGVLFVVVAVVVLVAGAQSSASCVHVGYGATGGSARFPWPKAIVALLAGTVVIVGLAALFEWLYEMQIEEEQYQPTSYVFLLDDSGSMDNNDPEQKRFSAVSEVLEGHSPDFPYAVYVFANETECLRTMQSISAGMDSFDASNYGGTAIKHALSYVANDLSRGVLEGGEHPRIVVLTDGQATDVGYFDTMSTELRKLKQAGASVSAVAFGAADEKMLTHITSTTGGTYVPVQDAGEIGQAMKEASVSFVDRNLLSSRFMANNDTLYALMRVMFLAILGIVIGLFCALVYGVNDAFRSIFVASVMASLIGAVLMEVGTCQLALPATALWLVLWVLVASIFAPKVAERVDSRRSFGSTSRRTSSRWGSKASRRFGRSRHDRVSMGFGKTVRHRM